MTKEEVIWQLESLKMFCEGLSKNESAYYEFSKDVVALDYAIKIIKKEPTAGKQVGPKENYL